MIFPTLRYFVSWVDKVLYNVIHYIHILILG